MKSIVNGVRYLQEILEPYGYEIQGFRRTAHHKCVVHLEFVGVAPVVPRENTDGSSCTGNNIPGIDNADDILQSGV